VAKYPETKTDDPTIKFLLWENYAEQKIMKFLINHRINSKDCYDGCQGKKKVI
jgi:hypothetical protein